jgi:hypothetical protein
LRQIITKSGRQNKKRTKQKAISNAYMMSSSFFYNPDLEMLQQDPTNILFESLHHDPFHDSLSFDMVDQQGQTKNETSQSVKKNSEAKTVFQNNNSYKMDKKCI